MKVVPVTGGWTLVDDEDEEFVRNTTCWISEDQDGRYRVQCRVQRRTRYLHQLLQPVGPDEQPDHVNRLTLDNRRTNLRRVTRKQNAANRGPHRDGKSRFKGVSPRYGGPGWIASLLRNGRSQVIGTFATEEEAACAFDSAARKEHGDYAYTNFDPDDCVNVPVSPPRKHGPKPKTPNAVLTAK